MNKQTPRSNIEWESWGEKDPLWGVAAWPGKEKGGADPWTDEAFYQLGKADWNDYQERWQKYGVNRRACLEIGCGAGRLTMHLPQFFERTYAVDVSAGMLTYAQQHIRSRAVVFCLVDGTTLPVATNSLTAVLSTYVFQHFDSLSYATQYFKEISRVLGRSGSMMIHLPIFQWPPDAPRIIQGVLRMKQTAKDIKAWLRRWFIVRGLTRPFIRSQVYPASYLYETLSEVGFTQIEICITSVLENGAHALVFARKDL